MIQDIAPYSFNVAYTPRKPMPEDIILIFSSREIYLTESDKFPTLRETDIDPDCDDLLFGFSIDDTAYYLFPADAMKEIVSGTSGLTAHSLRHLRTLPLMKDCFAGYTGSHLFNWYRQNRFCGCCGSKLVPGTDERKLVCPSCGNLLYPRINPCIIVAVHDGDRLLMTKYAGRPVTWFVLIAGFIEIGESAEDTVRREVMEEAGVKVKNIRYFGSQPWGIPGNLTLGYTAELDGDDTITIDETELAEGRWFERQDVPVPNDDLSITAAMIRAFADGKF